MKILPINLANPYTTTLLYISLLNNFLKKQHFYNQHQAEIDKKSYTKVRQHHEAEHLLFEKFYLKNCLFSLFTLLFKNDRKLSKKCAKKQVRLF